MTDLAFPLIWVTASGVEIVTEASQLPSEVGAKARGLLGLPKPWVPPFLVLSPTFNETFRETRVERRAEMLRCWTPVLERALGIAGLDGVDFLYLRSNAIKETLSERGKYRSVPSDRTGWLGKLAAFYEAEQSEGRAPLGVIVQRAIAARMSGHLSNERRVAKEFRDAIVEFVDPSGNMETASLTFRRWRNAMAASTDALACASRDDLLVVLREPLALAAERKLRVHYEWVWDGQFVYVVQADPAPDSDAGVVPKSVLGVAHPSRSITGLQLFREAQRGDESRSRKLKNHFLYEDNGFRQPPFFLLDNAAVLGDLLRGKADERLVSDLDVLTYRPLVIRTNSSTPANTLLPRSDLLCSSAAAVLWLTGTFREEALERSLRAEDVTLLAHHFIPALAAAFSTGSPVERNVYIEALWGIPEGLFYYPCDAYQVDTRVPDSRQLREPSKSKFAVQKVIRHKGEFVAPDAGGRFVLHQTARPWDWKSTIQDQSVLADIAFFTRKLASMERTQIKLMWFLECASWTGLPRALPWYHDNEAEFPSTQDEYSPNSRDERIDIRRLQDLESIEGKAAAGYRPSARRIVINLNPAEHEIIRNRQFADRVGAAAIGLNAVVELKGGILSHVYYILKSCGATVTVKNFASFSSQPAAVKKLVRDKIPAVVAAGGEVARISHLPPEQRRAALKIKLVEEALEVRDSNAEELIHEIADVLDVVDALIKVAQISRDELEEVRRRKQETRGGFEDGVILVETIPKDERGMVEARGGVPPLLPPDNAPRTRIINTGQPPPLEDARTGPFDIRRGDDFVEFVHTSTFRVTHPEWVLTSPRRIQVDAAKSARSIEWTLEGKRQGAQVKLRLKILLGTQQLSLPLRPKSRKHRKDESSQ